MGKFLSSLEVQFVDGNYWQLKEPLIYLVDDGSDLIRVPAGFYTDFASVPMVVNWLIPKSGEYDPAAVVHDFLYWIHSIAKKAGVKVGGVYKGQKVRPESECNGIFCEAMKALNVSFNKEEMMYLALQAFGWVQFNFGKKDKRNSEDILS